MAGASRTFKITLSERCFRFKPDALPSHAPHQPGVYEFVTFDPQVKPVILYVGVALDKTINQALGEHMMGVRKPGSEELFKAAKDVYFDFVAAADVADAEEWKDVAAALIAKGKPKLNAGPLPGSGRYASVAVEEVG